MRSIYPFLPFLILLIQTAVVHPVDQNTSPKELVHWERASAAGPSESQGISSKNLVRLESTYAGEHKESGHIHNAHYQKINPSFVRPSNGFEPMAIRDGHRHSNPNSRPDSSREPSPIQKLIKPQILPHWFHFPPASSKDTLYSIGISNPGMKKNKAMKLSRMRAKGIIAILHGTQIQNVRDVYSFKKQGSTSFSYKSTYQGMTRFQSQLACDSNFRVLDSCFTKYDEALVLMRYSKPKAGLKSIKKSDTLHVTGELFNYSMTATRDNLHHLMLEMDLRYHHDSTTDHLSYQYRNYHGKYGIKGQYNDSSLSVSKDYYYYKAGGNLKDTIVNDAIRFPYGLWNQYYERLIRTITGISLEKSVTLEDLTQIYSNISKEELIRTISDNTLRFRINSNSILKNRMAIDMHHTTLHAHKKHQLLKRKKAQDRDSVKMDGDDLKTDEMPGDTTKNNPLPTDTLKRGDLPGDTLEGADLPGHTEKDAPFSNGMKNNNMPTDTIKSQDL